MLKINFELNTKAGFSLIAISGETSSIFEVMAGIGQLEIAKHKLLKQIAKSEKQEKA